MARVSTDLHFPRCTAEAVIFDRSVFGSFTDRDGGRWTINCAAPA